MMELVQVNFTPKTRGERPINEINLYSRMLESCHGGTMVIKLQPWLIELF